MFSPSSIPLGEKRSSESLTFPSLLQSVKRFTVSRMYGKLKMLFVALAMVGGLLLLATTFSPYIKDVVHLDHATLQEQEKLPTVVEVQRNPPIVIRTTPTLQTAGLGSVVAQLRSGAALATMLGATYSTFPVTSTHSTQYQAAALLGLDLLENPLDANAKVCSIATSPYFGRTAELIETWCNSVMFPDEMDQAALEVQGYFGDCGLILDDRPWDARYDMSKCTWLWVKHFFTRLGLRRRETGIGLHIRWGDMSYNVGVPSGDPVTPQRSTPVPVAAELLKKMRSCGIQDELNVYMEWHNDTMLSGLGEPYRVIDNDSLEDLLDLSSNRIIILDLSSWTVLAHQIADGGLTIVPDVDQFSINWYDNGVNNVLRWNELLSIPCPDLVALLNP